MNRFRILTIFTALTAVLAMAGPALALDAENVSFNARVGMNGTGNGVVDRESTDETLEAFDTSACNGFTITPGATLPKMFTASDTMLAFTVAFMPAARTAYTCTVTMRGPGNSNLGTFDVTVTGVAPVLGVSETALAFGDVRVTGGTATRTFNVTNTGDAGETLSILSIATSGGAAGDFSVSQSAFPVPANGSTQVTVTFNPSDTGGRATQLVVTSNDPITATRTIELAGTGVEPMIATANDPTDFGVVAAGSSATRNVTVTNVGSGTLTVQSATLSSPSGSWFSFTATPQASCNNRANDCDFSPDLAITNNAVTVTLRCAPPAGASGSQSRTLTFASDTVGGDGQLTLSCTAGSPMIAANQTALAFGTIELNTNGDLLLEATNTGNETLTISSATFTNDQGGRYTVANGMTGNQTVAPGNKAMWTLRCRSATAGLVPNSTFRIASNAVNTPTLDLTASCRVGRLNTNRLDFSFGQVRAGDTVNETFTLTNNGPDAINNIAAVWSTNATNQGYSVVNLPATLAANGGSATVTVRFLPANGDAGGNHTLRITGMYGGNNASTAEMTLSGDGRTSGYTFDPATLDLGNVRWDRQVTRTVQIRNPYESTVRITSISVEVTNGTATGELAIVGGFTAQNLAPGGMLTTAITVRADPNNRLGAISGNLIANSDLGATVMPTRTLALTANSTSPAITSDPADGTFNFGPIDVDAATPPTKILTLTNSGNDVLDVGAATITAGRYTIMANNPGPVAPGAQYTVTVSYDPNAVATHSGTVTIPVSGIIDRTMPASFVVTGRGIDRTFSVADPGLFPETFRNPGSRAPVQEVLVTNTGEAPLNISAAMVTGEPVWTLVEGNSMRVEGGQTAAFKVRFAPESGGKAPTGKLIINHDDDANGNRGEIELNGFGKDPRLSVAPGANISLGTTAVGFPVKLSELFPEQLMVQNVDTEAFKVREVKLRDLNGGSAFSTDDDLAGEMLRSGDTKRFDVEFAADRAGEFAAQLEIYVDEDPIPATIVQLTGTAVGVDVQGGGGCQASGGDVGGLAGLGLGALAFFVMGRRRRKVAAVSVAVSAIALVLTASNIQAQSTSRNIDLTPFRPAPSTTGSLLHVESPFVGERGDWELGLAISFLTNPLQVETSMGETFNLVSQRTIIDLGVAFALAGRLELGARMATMNQDGDSERMVKGLEPGVNTAIGDAMLHAKVSLVRGVALAANVTLPTATDDAFAGSGKIGGSGLLLLGYGNRRFSASANLGFGYQDKVILGNITQGNRALVGAGAAYRATNQLTVTGELFGAIAVGQRDRDGASPLQGLLGLRYQAARTVGISLGVGTGIMRGIGAPALHGVVAFELSPNARAATPVRVAKPYVPPPDRDKDGIPDAEDRCADEPEDMDGFRDLDGCPDPDNDFDGVPDNLDRCPEEREDKDGIADDDGCPDVDDDGDNIPVPQDKCPEDREDMDGFEDEDGCPELDNDRDGIPDASDKCPLEPETINNIDDNDGCPDAGASAILLGRDRIDLVTPITFVGSTEKLTPDTLGLLAQVGATMRANPEIQRLRIGVHVNRRGKNDQQLSAKRAAALRDWLVQWGVEPHRLDVRGFGSTKLIVKAQRKDAAAINDRVELTIMQRGPAAR